MRILVNLSGITDSARMCVSSRHAYIIYTCTQGLILTSDEHVASGCGTVQGKFCTVNGERVMTDTKSALVSLRCTFDGQNSPAITFKGKLLCNPAAKRTIIGEVASHDSSLRGRCELFPSERPRVSRPLFARFIENHVAFHGHVLEYKGSNGLLQSRIPVTGSEDSFSVQVGAL
jgi:hypothetical protein